MLCWGLTWGLLNVDSMSVYQEQYNTALPAGSCIIRKVYTMKLDFDWTIRQARKGMELAIMCYFRAVELTGNKDISLVMRLANELGLLYMNQATAWVLEIRDNQELAVTAMVRAHDLFNFSRNQGIAKCESISDFANTALLLSSRISQGQYHNGR